MSEYDRVHEAGGVMAEKHSAAGYQSLGNGVYRVGAVRRSAVTGRYVVKGHETRVERSSGEEARGRSEERRK
ncbi:MULTISPECIES: hypothetical protein [Clavibacter]|uniref:Uncharacterized protein n=1 Tax=Clavibacter tessellarius TaxID=31965 RepID=A0A154V124_9MICO|nr:MULTISPECIES: hypothetical protein [Clavibacter]KZC95073.1 hypothetical protein AWH51_09845 [Clavibacter michiganensis subsp. tessellarius]MDA3805354.1 hypothetical protein [Clavibacter sp. CT19]